MSKYIKKTLPPTRSKKTAPAPAPSSSFLSKLPHYSQPIKNDLAVILVFFNPGRSVRIIQNILTVKYWLDRASIPYFIGEIAHYDSPFIFPEASNICRFRSSSLMFYKENLISVVEKIIPPQFTKLCLLDADILFMEPNWYDIISETLDTYDICQPFEIVNELNLSFNVNREKQSILNCHSLPINYSIYHTGYVWAMKRTWYKTIHIILDNCIIGSGDVCIYACIMRDYSVLESSSYGIYEHVKQSINNLPPVSYSTCSLNIIHLNHGTVNNRQYMSRFISINTMLKEIKIDSIRKLYDYNDNSIIDWKPLYKEYMNQHFLKYFVDRNDDSDSSGNVVTCRYKFYPTSYTTPSVKDTAVILVFFNPVKYVRPIQNILMVKHWLETANIPFYIVELAFDNEPFLFKESPIIFQTRSCSYMFYKENLMKYAERKIPQTYNKLCFIDCDIMFDTPNWYSIVSRTLDYANVIQPYKIANWLSIDYTAFLSKISNLSLPIEEGHVGFAYAFDRKMFNKINIEDRCCITTAGDIILSDILLKQRIRNNFLILDTFKMSHDTSGVIIGTSDCNIFHLNHGSRKKRHYWDIIVKWKEIFRTNSFSSIDDIIERRDDGIIEFKPTYRKEYNKLMIEYFLSREEDSGLAD